MGQPNQSQSMMQTMNQLYSAFQKSGNPMELLQNLAKSNPAYGNVLTALGNSNGDAKSAFYAMANQMGVDPNTILSQIPTNFNR